MFDMPALARHNRSNRAHSDKDQSRLALIADALIDIRLVTTPNAMSSGEVHDSISRCPTNRISLNNTLGVFRRQFVLRGAKSFRCDFWR